MRWLQTAAMATHPKPPLLLLAADLPSGCTCARQFLITHLPFREEVQAQVIEGRRDWEVSLMDRQLHSSA